MQKYSGRSEYQSFKNGQKRNFRKNGHFQITVPLQWLNQIKSSDWHFKVHIRSLKKLVVECPWSQISIFGILFSATRFDDTVIGRET